MFCNVKNFSDIATEAAKRAG